MRTDLGNQRRRLVAALFVVFTGCATVSVRVTPEGNTELDRGDVTLEVPTRELSVLESHTEGWWAGQPYVFANSAVSGIVLSAALDEASPEACATTYLRRVSHLQGFKLMSRRPRGQFDAFEYELPETTDPSGVDTEIQQRNIIGCKTLGHTTAVIHVSKVNYVEDDDGLFAQVFEQTHLRAR